MPRFASLFAFAALLLAVPAAAQQAPALDHDAYDIWTFINESHLSDDGRWAAWSMGPEEADAVLHAERTDGTQEYSVARGTDAQFSPDSRHLAFTIAVPTDTMRAAKLADVKPDDQPKDSLGILTLATGEVVRVPRVQSFQLPADAGAWIAYLLDDSSAETDTTATDTTAVEGESEEDDDKEKEPGTDLVLRSLETGAEQRYLHAKAYHFTDDGSWLVYTAASEDGTADGVYAVDLSSGDLTAAAVLTGEGDYTQLATDEAGSQLAFLSNRATYADDQPAFALYRVDLGDGPAALVADETTAGVPDGWWIGEHGDVHFSENGTRLFFGTQPRPMPEPDDEDVLEEEQVELDIWSWTDPLLQPMQLEQADEERRRTYLAVAHLDEGRVVQLGTESLPDVEVGSKGNADVALANTFQPYRQEISWDWPRYYDIYTVDVRTGDATQRLEAVQSQASLSPDAQYFAWWDRDLRGWFALDATGGDTRIALSAGIPHPVYDEQHDWPFAPDAYGTAGWTDDGQLLIYDKHDVWAADPDGTPTVQSLTDGVGRDQNLRFRALDLDDEEPGIASGEPLLLYAFDMETKASGFYRDRIGGGQAPTRLVMADERFSRPQKADDSDHLLFTRESFRTFPDLWTSTLAFDTMERLSDANPQQADYRWGTAERITWTSLDGEVLEGLLYKPDGFDPSATYPLMVYFYEKNSDNLHSHVAPQPFRSIINRTFYVSRGYVVFVPDIPYKIGYPGESAMNAVMPGVTHLLDQGYIDRDRVGVQGHSWGGYQIAYMVTQTNLFAAAEAGAPVSNMTSAYGGIRWGSGMSRMFQYERTQSRIGGSLWEKPLRYIHNSPLFQADKIETPLLMMHNDQDTAVPWEQGIELFVALRRLGKPAWLLNYNDEPHNLTRYAHKKDWAVRMQQFFDYYLMDAPAPVWMEEGIPAVEKGRTLGLEPVATDKQ